MASTRCLMTLMVGLVALGRPLAAQTDYRNLDDDRPTRVEDAYPVEHYAFEAVLPYQLERDQGDVTVHSVVPELSYGVFANTQIGIKLPLAITDGPGGSHTGLSGLRLFALYNFNIEGPALPALSLRVDGAFPVGSLAGDRSRVSFEGIATRSWGKNRIHLNGAFAAGPDDATPAVEGLPRWWAGAALDRTLFRQSTLLIAELYLLRAESTSLTEINASVGARYQWTPTTVLDIGVRRRLRSAIGPDIALTIGLSHSFAVAGLMPGRPVR